MVLLQCTILLLIGRRGLPLLHTAYVITFYFYIFFPLIQNNALKNNGCSWHSTENEIIKTRFSLKIFCRSWYFFKLVILWHLSLTCLLHLSLTCLACRSLSMHTSMPCILLKVFVSWSDLDWFIPVTHHIYMYLNSDKFC